MGGFASRPGMISGFSSVSDGQAPRFLVHPAPGRQDDDARRPGGRTAPVGAGAGRGGGCGHQRRLPGRPRRTGAGTRCRPDAGRRPGAGRR
ncbi:hypothetical protein G6F40_017816 [Rhizopus arrhizus]|nr:hypothetical protein G6F40_017816 [Rhizopus arrhizus]KAG1246507.1 hypothetical protein G6F65_020647 [Rhizopus arrhizus]